MDDIEWTAYTRLECMIFGNWLNDRDSIFEFTFTWCWTSRSCIFCSLEIAFLSVMRFMANRQLLNRMVPDDLIPLVRSKIITACLDHKQRKRLSLLYHALSTHTVRKIESTFSPCVLIS